MGMELWVPNYLSLIEKFFFTFSFLHVDTYCCRLITTLKLIRDKIFKIPLLPFMHSQKHKKGGTVSGMDTIFKYLLYNNMI